MYLCIMYLIQYIEANGRYFASVRVGISADLTFFYTGVKKYLLTVILLTTIVMIMQVVLALS